MDEPITQYEVLMQIEHRYINDYGDRTSVIDEVETLVADTEREMHELMACYWLNVECGSRNPNDRNDRKIVNFGPIRHVVVQSELSVSNKQLWNTQAYSAIQEEALVMDKHITTQRETARRRKVTLAASKEKAEREMLANLLKKYPTH